MKKYTDFIHDYILDTERTIRYYNLNNIKIYGILLLLGISSLSYSIAEAISKGNHMGLSDSFDMLLLSMISVLTIGMLNTAFIVFMTGLIHKRSVDNKKVLIYAILPGITTIISTPIALVLGMISHTLINLFFFAIAIYQIILYFKSMKIILKISIWKIILYSLTPYLLVSLTTILIFANL